MDTAATRGYLFKGYQLAIRRVFSAPPARVFFVWTNAQELCKWWGPKNFSSPFCSIDLRIGGEYHYCSRSPYGVDFFSKGTFLEIIPGERIVATDSFSDAWGNIISASSVGLPSRWPSTLLLTVTFEEHDQGTLFTLRHEGLPGEMIRHCTTGWSEALDKLEAIL
jgi:uncharacterized protein YndB with AHSA1/START domain